jgi:hypothetical protein
MSWMLVEDIRECIVKDPDIDIEPIEAEINPI